MAKNKGFTLIELLVVIAIIGLLSAVVLVSLNSARSKSRNAKRLADIKQIMTAMEVYYNDNAAYPDTSTTFNPTGPPGTSFGPGGSATVQWSTFLSVWPTTPTPADGTCNTTALAGALPANPPTTQVNQYTYIGMNAANTAADTDGDPPFYRIYTCLGAPTGGLNDTNADGRVSVVATPSNIIGN